MMSASKPESTAGIKAVVVCPTARFAAGVKAAHSQGAALGEGAWLTPTVYSFSSWLEALASDYFFASDDDRVLINTVQSEYIWQSLVDDDVFVGQPSVAGLAMDAWRRLHEHCLVMPERWEPGQCSEDALAFVSWSQRYVEHCVRHSWVDQWAFAAELPGLVAQGLVELPGRIECLGFVQPRTPLQQRLLQAFADAGVPVDGLRQESIGESDCSLTSVLGCVDPDAEIRAAAAWARRKLGEIDAAARQRAVESSNNTGQSVNSGVAQALQAGRIAVVVPDLASRLDSVERIFREEFDAPGFCLEPAAPSPWHISLGRSLQLWPLVADALALLQLRPAGLPVELVTQLLRSPFLAGFEEEQDARADTLNALFDRAPYRITAVELIREADRHGASILAGGLGRWRTQVEERPGLAWPSEWLAAFTRQLAALGFGRGRSLDSVEYQCLQRWHSLLESLSDLDSVYTRPIDRSEMVRMLQQSCGAAVFREQNTGAEVDVLGVEEAIGVRYEAAWLTSLDAETWPGQPRRDPLIPGVVQASVPAATQSGTLALARLQLAALSALAPRVRGSFCPISDQITRELSALVRLESGEDARAEQSPATQPEIAPVSYVIDDIEAPALQTSSAEPIHSGGTGVLRDMAQCPFRAFAVHRIGAKDRRPAKPGLSPLHRGNAVHKALELFWQGVKSHAQLVLLADAARAAVIEEVVQRAIEHSNKRFRLTIAGADVAAETERLAHLLDRWLELDRDREPFTVVGVEQRVELALGPLRFEGSVDRIDQLAEGSFLVIDYKSRAPTIGEWLSPREDSEHRFSEPQLPAYALNLSVQPTAVAFAQLLPQELKFAGVSAEATGIPGIKAVEKAGKKFAALNDWDALTSLWRRGLLQLAESYVAGDAIVDPLKNACDYCHLQAACRINERRAEAIGDDDATDSDWQGFSDE